MISKAEWGKDGEKTGKVVRGDCKVPTRIWHIYRATPKTKAQEKSQKWGGEIVRAGKPKSLL